MGAKYDNPPVDGFTGHIGDYTTGLTYMQARFYDPMIGRFLSIDPVGFAQTGAPQQFNRYAYAWNDRVNKTDPDGRYCVPCIPPIVAAVEKALVVTGTILVGAAAGEAAGNAINEARSENANSGGFPDRKSCME